MVRDKFTMIQIRKDSDIRTARSKLKSLKAQKKHIESEMAKMKKQVFQGAE